MLVCLIAHLIGEASPPDSVIDYMVAPHMQVKSSVPSQCRSPRDKGPRASVNRCSMLEPNVVLGAYKPSAAPRELFPSILLDPNIFPIPNYQFQTRLPIPSFSPRYSKEGLPAILSVLTSVSGAHRLPWPNNTLYFIVNYAIETKHEEFS